MAHALTPDQLAALRHAPLGTMANKLEFAFALVKAKQTDVVAAYPDQLSDAMVSRIVNGKITRVDVRQCHLFAEFFGCQIEDLFPLTREEAVAE